MTYRRRHDSPLHRVLHIQKNELKVIKKVMDIFRLFVLARGVASRRKFFHLGRILRPTPRRSPRPLVFRTGAAGFMGPAPPKT